MISFLLKITIYIQLKSDKMKMLKIRNMLTFIVNNFSTKNLYRNKIIYMVFAFAIPYNSEIKKIR